MYNGFSKKFEKSLKMDLNISEYVVFQRDFESAVQMDPSITQKSKKGQKLNQKIAIFRGGRRTGRSLLDSLLKL